MRPMTRRTGAAPVGITCALCTVMSIDALTKQISLPESERRHFGFKGSTTATTSIIPEALDAFEAAIALEPDEPTNQRLAAATLWMRLLFEQGAVTVEDYLGQARSNVPRRPPSASLAAAFQHHLDRATALAEQHLRDHRNDAEAHFQLGAVAALRASYVATVEGRVRDSVGAARRAYKSHERSLTLDPQRRGRRVHGRPLSIRDRQPALGIAAHCSDVPGSTVAARLELALSSKRRDTRAMCQTDALFTLSSSTTAKGVTAEALRIIQQLQQRYPRNRLLWLEAAGTALRAGRHRDALEAVDEGLAKLAADPRPRAYGEDARWQRQREAIVKAMRGPSTGGHQ